MLGIPDFTVFMAFFLSVVSAVICLVYGFINWNKGSENEIKEIEDEIKWAQEEAEIDELL